MKTLNWTLDRLSPWQLSSLFHGMIFLMVATLIWPKSRPSTVDFEVLEMPKASPQAISMLKAPKEAKTPLPDTRKVFGVSRKSITSDDAATSTEVKQGNTVAKEFDDEKLKDDDQDLPIPADELMVTAMPKLQSEVRIPYPPEAKAKGIQGAVVMDILIDAQGQVREVKLIQGPGAGLNEAALEAVKQFKFIPARIEAQVVAVRIRYAYRFVLEK